MSKGQERTICCFMALLQKNKENPSAVIKFLRDKLKRL